MLEIILKNKGSIKAISKRILVIVLVFQLILPMFSSLANATLQTPTGDQVLNTLKTRYPNKSHPRILGTAADFIKVQQNIVNDNFAKNTIYPKIKSDARAILDLDPPSTMSQANSREILRRITILAMMVQINEDTAYISQYVTKAYAILSTAAGFQNWNPSQFLDTAEMMTAFAIGYDWLYHKWTTDQKSTIRNAIVNKGLLEAEIKYDLGFEANGAWWAKRDINWNAVCNSGIANAVLAVGDETTETERLTKKLMPLVIENIPNALHPAKPDGYGDEGSGYWEYNFKYFAYYGATMFSALGTDYGFTTHEPGMAETGYYPIYLNGPKGSFNYGDNYNEVVRDPLFLWLAKNYNNKDFAWNRLGQIKASSSTVEPLDLLWYDPVTMQDPRTGSSQYTLDLPLDKLFKRYETNVGTTKQMTGEFGMLGMMRSAWNNSNALSVALKGGNNLHNHNHLDLGTFVLDALGERWAVDLGPDSYSLPNYFEMKTGRSQYYRLRTEGHNTLVLNPSSVDGQAYNAVAPIERTGSAADQAFMIMDMTDGYKTHANQVKRGMALINNRTQFLLQDEVAMKSSGEFYWFMHTKATITLENGGKRALLTMGTKQMRAYILPNPSQPNLVFTVSSATPLPTSPNPDGQKSNAEYTKLTIHGTNITNLQLAVLFVPAGTTSQTLPSVTALADWSIPGTEVPNDGTIDLIATDDTFVRGGTNANTNYNSSNGLEIKGDSSDSYKRQGFMKFDLSSISSTARIASATLSINAAETDQYRDTGTLKIYPATGTWSEGSLTWNTKPAVGSTSLGSATVDSTYKWYDIDVTDYVKGQLDTTGKIANFALQQEDDTGILLSVRSREQEQKPTLKIVLADGIAWEFTNSVQDWTNISNIDPNTYGHVSGGYVYGKLTSSDPQMSTGDNLNLDIDKNKIIRVRMKNDTSRVRAKVYFGTDTAPTPDEPKSGTFTLVANSNYTEYVLDMSSNTYWTGTLKKLRFDPIDNGSFTPISTDAFSIDYIRIEPMPAPVASNVSISGQAEAGKILTGSYTFNHELSKPEAGTTFRWLRANTVGGEYTEISGATGQTYTLTTGDVGKFIKFEVTPKIAGKDGTAVSSSAVGAVISDITPPTWNSGSVTAPDVTPIGLTLAWSGASSDTTAYAVYKGGVLLNNNVTNTGYVINGLTPDTSYSFKIEARDLAGNWSTNGPSITLTTPATPEGTILLPATDDAFVRGGTNAGNNYNSANIIEVKSDPNDSYTRQGFIKFDLSSITAPIASATLSMNAAVTDANRTTGTLKLHPATGTWSESSVTWNSKPAIDTNTLLSSISLDSEFKWYDIDVTNYVKGQISSSNNVANFGLLQQDDIGIVLSVHTHELAQQPKLTIVLQNGIAWEFTNNTENWSVANVSNFVHVSGGYVTGNLVNKDPQMISPDNLGIEIGSNSNKIIRIRMKNTTSRTRAKIYFETNTLPMHESRTAVFNIVANSDYTEYVIDMSSNTDWTGTLKRLRFDPIDNGDFTVQPTDSFSVDYIRVEP